jgi:CheY-like chemotaxis protein
MTVLVVDDNPINRFVLRQQLLESGHRVTEAADGAEGVSAAGRTRFDLILLDISMPGLDGIEAARRIRSGPGPSRAARIVAVTAHAQPGEQERFRAAGMEGCLVKPVTRAMLAALLTGTPAEPAPAPAAAAAAPEVDPAILADLVDRLGAEPARLLIRRFLDEGDATIARLAVGLPPDEAGALCHRFAGSAATFGAVALARRLSVAETALALGAAPPDEIAALARAWAASRARISADLPAAPRQDSRAAG